MQVNDGFWDAIDERWQRLEGLRDVLVEAGQSDIARGRKAEAALFERGEQFDLIAVEATREQALVDIQIAERKVSMTKQVESVPEHKGMFIPFAAPRQFHPTSYAGNYEIHERAGTYTVRRYVTPQLMPDGSLGANLANYLKEHPDGLATEFETREEALQAVYRDKLDAEKYHGGIYEAHRVDGVDGWTVLMEHNWSMTHEHVPWSAPEPADPRSQPGPTL